MWTWTMMVMLLVFSSEGSLKETRWMEVGGFASKDECEVAVSSISNPKGKGLGSFGWCIPEPK